MGMKQNSKFIKVKKKSHWKWSFGLVFADKSEADADRERALMDQWVCLTEERNAVMVPSPGSGIPGAPAD
jgi:hypothetical protein